MVRFIPGKVLLLVIGSIILLSPNVVESGEAPVSRVGLADFFRITGAQGPVYNFDDMNELECVDARFGCTRLPGVGFRSISQEDEYVVGVHAVTGPRTEPYALRAGPSWPRPYRYVIRMDFDRPQTGVGFWVTTLAGHNSCSPSQHVVVTAAVVDGGRFTTTLHGVGGAIDPEFMGLITVSGEPGIEQVLIEPGLLTVCGETDFPMWGMDTLTFVPGPVPPPRCERTITNTREARGSVTVNVPTIGGIAAVGLADGADNMVLELDPAFEPGAESVDYVVRRTDPSHDAFGTVVARDMMNGSCVTDIDLRSPTRRETAFEVWRQGFRSLTIRGATARTTTSASVSASNRLLDSSELPPGFGIFETDRGRPTCDVLTVDGDFGDYDAVEYMVLAKYDPRIRLLASYSPDGGTTFPPFEDVTESAQIRSDSRPALVLLTGRPGTGTFRLTCAHRVAAD